MSDSVTYIGDEKGFTPHMSRLVGMMRYTRLITRLLHQITHKYKDVYT
jgi:hypothetical protein